ncbi:M1 family metallopeptidase [bacterium]|nr:M1 family metallopeptidase [bacterium]
MRVFIWCSLILSSLTVFGQGYWQQEVAYEMFIDMNVKTNQFQGNQKLKYTNHSPDTLTQVFYHLYFNAFQPNSMMDVRSRLIEDPDRRVGDRILSLKEDEIGYQKIDKLTQDGKKLKYQVEGTILEVELAKPILPGQTTIFEMDFNAQVPLQVRRSGRDNKEGIRYSMTQWYPKMVEYDYQGWNANPYIGREFHGVWGSFDVKISIDKSYVLGGTGYVKNPEVVQHGYGSGKSNFPETQGEKITWHFNAPLVHDFAWVADPDFKHTTSTLDNGTVLHFLYQPDTNYTAWDSLPQYGKRIFEIMNANFGEYPYKQYTVAQGGDGGMEYPMLTLITGKRSKGSLIGVTVHEANHSWYQHLLATNEALYPWMDEGFTSYASDFVMHELFPTVTPYEGSYRSYYSLVESGKQEALTTHADHYETNRAYGTASYSMGLIFLHQLGYIVGEEVLMRSMRRYFAEWKYKHPTPNDFIRIVEKESGLELTWYLEQWIGTTSTIDYGIKWLQENDETDKTHVILERKGKLPMPLDIKVVYKDGKEEWINIPLRIMRGEKIAEKDMEKFSVKADWPWTFPTYELILDCEDEDIESIEIDPSKRMADIDRSNNIYPKKDDTMFKSN